MIEVIPFANTFGLIVLVLHPIIYWLLKRYPKSYVWTVHLAAFGIVPHLDRFDYSFKNMVVGTLIKAALFWLIAALGACVYNWLI